MTTPLTVAFALIAPMLGLVIGKLVVSGNWTIALGLVLALPFGVLLHKYPLMGLLLWLLLAPLLMNTPTDNLRRIYWVIHRALPPAAVAIIVVSTLLRIRTRDLPRLGPAELAMGGYLAASLVSTIYLSNSTRATIYLIYDSVFVPMALYLLVRLSNPDQRELKRMVALLLLVCLFQVFIGLVSWAAPGLLPSMWRNQHVGNRTIGTLVNPTTYTLGLAFCSVFLLHAALNQESRPVRALYIAGFMLANLLIFLSFTRSSWLGALLVIIGLLFLYPGFMVRLILIAGLVLGVFGGVLLSDQLDRASDRLYSSQSEESALSRLPIFYAAIRMFLARPLFGWGYNNFDRYDREFQGRVGDLVNAQKDHASHNTFLTLLAEQGITGFALFLMPAVWWLSKTRRAVRRLPRDGFWSGKLLIVCWLFVLFFVVVNNFFRVYLVFGIGLYWIALGLIAILIQSQERTSRERDNPTAVGLADQFQTRPRHDGPGRGRAVGPQPGIPAVGAGQTPCRLLVLAPSPTPSLR